MKIFKMGCLVGIMLFVKTSAFAQSQTVYLSQDENTFYQMINQFRNALGLPNLVIHVLLQEAAKNHSAWMASKDFLSHYGPTDDLSPFERMKQLGYVNFTSAGENIASGKKSAVDTFRQWAASPSHLENMLNPHYHQLGVSRAYIETGRFHYYWTTDFGSFTSADLDPPAVTDLNLIAKAIAQVSGRPLDKPVALPSVTENEENGDDEAGNEGSPTQAAPVPTATPSRNLPASGSVNTLQCMIPARLGKGSLTNLSGTDTLIEATRTSNGLANVKLSFFQNAETTSLAPVLLSGVSVISNPDFPLVSLFSAPLRSTGGFTVQMNTQTNQAHFESYGFSPSIPGEILCTVKYF